MERFREDFPSKIKGIDFETLENSNHTIFGLSRAMDLIYFNPAYVLFAQNNGFDGDFLGKFPLGTPIYNVLSCEKLLDFYVRNYEGVLVTGEVWSHEYECSSNVEFRQFHQGVYPLKNKDGLIIINSLKVDVPMHQIDRKAQDALSNRYLQPNGYITQCSNCRHCQRAGREEIWDWVPAWVERMPANISHSICPTCFDYHWKYAGFKSATTNTVANGIHSY